MVKILETFNDTWNYTFLIVAIVSIAIGTLIVLYKTKKAEKQQKKHDNKN